MDSDRDLLRAAGQQLTATLGEVPGLEIWLAPVNAPGERGADLEAEVLHGGRRYLLLAETKTTANSRSLAEVAAQLRHAEVQTSHGEEVVPIVVVPQMGPRAAEMARKLGLGYVDLQGNAHLEVGPVYIHIRGTRSAASVNPVRSMFAPKASRILGVLLTEPETAHRQTDIACAAGVSQPLVSNTVRRLIDECFCERRSRGIVLLDPGPLLDQWADNYRQRVITWRRCYALYEDRLDFARDLTQRAADRNAHIAFTGPLAANVLAPYVISDIIHVYADEDGATLLELLGARPVADGGNVLANCPPWDEGVFFRAGVDDGIRLAHPVQVYLDLLRLSGRGEEAAEVFRERTLSF